MLENSQLANVPASPEIAQRVLVVDDYEDSLTTLALLVRLLGHEVRSACNGSDAIRIARDFLPTVILLDIGLPDIDGHEVAKKLRSYPETLHARIVALTGFGLESDRQDALTAGCDYHMTKPLGFLALVEILSASPSSSAIASRY